MIPAVAAIPFMTLRLSILGKKFPFASANGPNGRHARLYTSDRDPR